MVSVNFANFVTVGLLALVFYIAISWISKQFGISIPGLPA